MTVICNKGKILRFLEKITGQCSDRTDDNKCTLPRPFVCIHQKEVKEPQEHEPPFYPPTCHLITKAGSQATRKVSPKHFKPRTAHEKKLLKTEAKLKED